MQGGSLLDKLKRVKVFPEEEVLLIVKIVLKAMKYCHTRNITHRYTYLILIVPG